MARILTGIQSSGKPHLGNILGAILPAIKLANAPENESYIFIADFHALTTVKKGAVLRENTLSVAAAWLAFGLNTDKTVFYRQSDVAEVCQLAWMLNCFTPYPMLANAHSFKDKADNLADVNAGLFTYPVLMTADILLYDANVVPVGKDQKQHLEIAREIAGSVNYLYPDTFIVPEPSIQESVMTIPGTDGRKMSKSYNNYLDVFLPEKELRKKVMSIVTDATPLEEPKNPDTCTVYNLYSLLASPAQTEAMRHRYLEGNYGYGSAKQALFEVIIDVYSTPRNQYAKFMDDPAEIDRLLGIGAEKARHTANGVLNRVRQHLGFA